MNDEDEAVGAWQGPAAFATFIYDDGVVSCQVFTIQSKPWILITEMK
jgi:probable HAF family extracellular repeat protein